jgi:hypothetical protein
MSNRKIFQEENILNSKYKKNKINKQNKKSDIRNKRNNKNFFQYEDSILNELPYGSFDKNNKIYPESFEQINEDNSSFKESNEKKDNLFLTSEINQSDEEYTPDYFEPVVYKK